MTQKSLPPKGKSHQEVLDLLKSLKTEDATWNEGRMFGLIYDAGREVENLVKEAASTFLIENALSPMAFPSLLKMETEAVSMVLTLTGGDDEAVGSVTSGGTESIFMAIKAARDWARKTKPDVTAPELVAPVSAHPAWNKAADYLGLKIIMTPLDADMKADMDALEAAITPNTVAIGGTAVTYPHGVIDPIDRIGALAEKHKLWMHVDACLGGLILPFLKKLNYPIPNYGLNVPGVTSVSADIHKYAYTPKGISTVLFRNMDFRRHMFFAYADWPGGVYGTPSLSGARPGGTIAATWAVMQFLGEEGFLDLAQKTKQATDKMIAGVKKIPELYVLGDPAATVFSFSSDEVNIYDVGARMHKKGWHLDGQHLPPSLHMTVSPVHAGVPDQFLSDLAEAVAEAEKHKDEPLSGQAAMYAMIGTMPDRNQAKDFALDYLNDLYRIK